MANEPIKSFTKSMSRDELDHEVSLYEKAGVEDIPTPSSFSNKGEVIEWLEGAVEEHGYALELDEEDIAELPEGEDYEPGDVVLAEQVSEEEAEELEEDSEEASDDDAEEEDEETDEESDDEEEEQEEAPEEDESEDEEDAPSTKTASEAIEDEVESKSLDVEEGGPAEYEGTIDGKKITDSRNTVLGGRSYVQFELEDMTIQKLSHKEIAENPTITKVEAN